MLLKPKNRTLIISAEKPFGEPSVSRPAQWTLYDVEHSSYGFDQNVTTITVS